MEKAKIFEEVSRLIKSHLEGHKDDRAIYLEALQLLKVTDTSDTFYKHLSSLPRDHPSQLSYAAISTLRGFKGAIEHGLIDEKPIRVRIQGEIISDFLGQAEQLLNTTDIHPAAPAIIIGATLEEFLRNWCSKENIEIHGKESIDTYAKGLKDKDFIGKQDMKDITSWAGLRNEATHGKFSEVSDINRIKLMLEGVNLFIRKYS